MCAERSGRQPGLTGNKNTNGGGEGGVGAFRCKQGQQLSQGSHAYVDGDGWSFVVRTEWALPLICALLSDEGPRFWTWSLCRLLLSAHRALGAALRGNAKQRGKTQTKQLKNKEMHIGKV